MKRFAVTTSRPYDILVGENLLADTGALLAEQIKPCKVCLITDSRVNGLYSQVVMTSLMEHGFQASKIVFPEGEHSKNITTFTNVLEALSEENLSRRI